MFHKVIYEGDCDILNWPVYEKPNYGSQHEFTDNNLT